MPKRGSMFYLLLGVIGLVLVAVSLGFFLGKRDSFGWLRDQYDLRYSTSEVSLGLLGANFSFSIKSSDKNSAWKILNQIETRIGAVKFNEEYDSFIHTNSSLYVLFTLVRDEISKIPFEKFVKDEEMVSFYHQILNEGIRPYLSKWHIQIEHFHEQHKNDGKSILEIEKQYPRRKELLKDIEALNQRMKEVTNKLKEIIKS